MTRFSPVAVLLILSLLLPLSTHSACDQTQRYSSQYRSTYTDLAVEGNDLWATTIYGVELLDRSAGAPRILGSLALRGATSTLASTPTLAYVGSGNEIIVVRRSLPLQIIRTVNVGASVNDLLYLPPYLYAATQRGVVQLDLFAPESPAVARTLNTTSGTANSLARLDSTLYAADGDSSVEAYSIAVPSLPQKVGVFTSLPRSTGVSVAGGRVFVSDGQQTEIFVGSGAQMTRSALLSGVGGTSVFPAADSIHWLSGSDRRLRAIDLADVSNPIVVYEAATPATAGSVNRVGTVTGASGLLYVAAGDGGLRTINASELRRPFPIRSIPTGPLRTIATTGNAIFASLEEGGILRGRLENGSFTPGVTFDLQTRQTIADVKGDRLLSYAGSSITLWNVAADAAVASRAVLSSPVISAILVGTDAYAVLSDRSLHKVNLSAATGTSSSVTPAGTRPLFIANEGARIATAEVSEEGRTTLRLYSAALAVEREAVIDGAATGGIAVSSGGLIASSTFRGVTIFDGVTGDVKVLEASSGVLARDLRFRGEDLYVVTREAMIVWNTRENRRIANVALPPDASSIDVIASSGIAAIATTAGIVLVDSTRLSALPSELSAIASERFYTKQALSGSTLYLLDGRRIDVFRATSTSLSVMATIFSADAIVDLTATEGKLVILSSSGKLASYEGASATPSREVTISEGDDVVFNSLHSAGRAIYLSLSKGCLSGSCEKKTLVFDVASLTQTATMTGAILDLSLEGTTGFAVVDLPSELRILNLTDPLRPSIVRSRSNVDSSEFGGIVSLTRSRIGTLVGAGRKLYLFSEESFAKTGELLETYVADPSGRITILDQRVRVLGDCLVLIGRAHEPLLFTVSSTGMLTAAGTFRAAAAVKKVDLSPSTFHFLTDYSIDVWSSLSTPPATRQRGGRR